MIRNVRLIRQKSRRLRDAAAGFCLGAAVGAGALAWLNAPDPPAIGQGLAEARPVEPSGSGVRASALQVIDGDTFEARVAAFPGQEIVTRVRLAGVDAPERRGRCAGETAAAAAATTALARLVDGRTLTLTEVRGDKYFGRVVARVASREAGDLAEALIAAGHGRAYAGGRRTGWCG